MAAVLLLAALLQLTALGRAPINIWPDEARFAIQAQAIAATGRDLNGTRIPLFVHITNPLIRNDSTFIWWQPVLFYAMALVLQFAPFAEWSARLPNAAIAILNVWLIYAVARRLFPSAWYAVLAAFLLALTPVHFLFGRMATDYFCPVPFALAWLWCLVVTVQTEKVWMPAVTGLVLGVGLYSYIASWIVMPAYLAVTFVVLWLSGKPFRATLMLVAGFAVPLLPLIPWLWFHPTMPQDVFQDYAIVTSFRPIDRVSFYWGYFNPSYLFFSGGSHPIWTTSRAGMFPLAVAVLLPCGVWSIWRHDLFTLRAVLLFGFLFAPVPIVATLPHDPGHATARHLLAIPFGVLLSVAGVEWLTRERGRLGRVGAALLVVSVPLQFVSFARDYFTDYQVRSANRFDYMNFRGVAEYVVANDASSRVPAVYLSAELGEDKAAQWKFHLLTRRRLDVFDRTRYVPVDHFDANAIPRGSLLVLNANNTRLNELLGPERCSLLTMIHDAAGEPAAAILRRN
jgi:4-amino-4-deoxy-L-arabinose transferase-like glycosyltransferase